MMKKRILSFILLILTLIPLLLSCGGELPEKTPEPATPEAATPEVTTPAPEQVSLPFEGGYLTNGSVFGLKQADVIVFDSMEKLTPYMEMLDNEMQRVAKFLTQDSITPTNIIQHMGVCGALYNTKNTLNRYYKESFFENNVLVWFISNFYADGYSTGFMVDDVSITETENKKQLQIDATKVSGGFGSDGEVIDIIFLAIPRDHGVDLTNDVVFNWKYVSNSLYYPERKQ